VPVQRSAPQNFSPDKHVDVRVDSDEDRGSTPLASSLRSERSEERGVPGRSGTKAGRGPSFSINAALQKTTALAGPVEIVFIAL